MTQALVNGSTSRRWILSAHTKMAKQRSIEVAFDILRSLPRVCLSNIRDNPGSRKRSSFGRGQHGGKTHGCGVKARQNYLRLGYESTTSPFYLRIPKEPYYEGHHLRRQYPPLTLLQLQRLIDMGYLNPEEPIDLTAICNTKRLGIYPDKRHFGVNLTDEGMDMFKAKVNIEVQWTSEPVIAAIERNGGVITTAYYDVSSLIAVVDPLRFFKKGVPIPKRMLPPQDAIQYYTDPKFRGYLADPEKIAEERVVLAQKYGYQLPNLKDDPQVDMLLQRKDPRQPFYGLEPGWVVNLKDKVILKPKDDYLKEYYTS